ncbi:MAG: Atg14 domain-containing protein [Candidatus Aminicenantes bacterium]|nr:Atg14 domain-containing protein [Candidatus Aminicenantes bacterium]
MLIANPMYDTVFKYLMENLNVAKGIISTIIAEEILTLDFIAQEQTHRAAEPAVLLFHLDFIAKIRMKNGGSKTVLIELQKSNIPYDILRFRRYLGKKYTQADDVLHEDGTVTQEALPIITIYFLGFNIDGDLPAVIKVNRKYIDLLGGKEITEKNDFIERLTHDSYVIQVKRLELKMRTELEYVLSVFKQENFIEDMRRRVKRYDYEPQDELMRLILRQLEKAAGDDKLLAQIEAEELSDLELENAFGKIKRQLLQRDKEIEQKAKELEMNRKTIEEKDKAIEEKEKRIRELLSQLKDR